MINRPKLKMVTDISKRLFYQYIWINIFLIWNNIKRSVVAIAEKLKKEGE